jgi:hypothetical protein
MRTQGDNAKTDKPSRPLVDAPGKRHRKPATTAHGVKHSDETIAKARSAARVRKSGTRE